MNAMTEKSILKKNISEFNEIYICDKTIFEKIQNKEKVAERDYAHFKLQDYDINFKVHGANCLLKKSLIGNKIKNQVFVSTISEYLITEENLEETLSLSNYPKGSHLHLAQFKLTSGELLIVYVNRGPKGGVKYRKISFKLPRGICTVKDSFDESYTYNQKLTKNYNSQFRGLEIRHQFAKNPEDMHEIIEKMTDLFEIQKAEGLEKPNIHFLYITHFEDK